MTIIGAISCKGNVFCRLIERADTNMHRKLFIFSVGFVVSITLRPIPSTAQQKDAPRNAVRQNLQPPTPSREGDKPQQKAPPAQPQAADDLRGTDKSPVVVRVLPTPKTQEEATNEKTQCDDQSAANW